MESTVDSIMAHKMILLVVKWNLLPETGLELAASNEDQESTRGKHPH